MTGVFTADREAVIELEVRGPAGAKLAVAAVVDTGFTGYLTLPQDVISALGLRYHSQTTALLADGSRVSLAKYQGVVAWDGAERDIIVLQSEGGPLIGVSMLYGNRLTLDVVDGGIVATSPLLP